METKNKKKVVLAYSGGLDTSVILKWLEETYGYEVIAACVNVGQTEDFAAIKKKALATGASKAYIVDVTEEFITDYIFPTLKAGAVYEDDYLLGTSFARPLISKKLVEIAEKEGAVAIAHGATGKGNDQVRFEATIKALNPNLKIIAPWRTWDLKSREDCIDYAVQHGIPIPVTKKDIYSRDENIWHISHEGGNLENPWNEHDDTIYKLSVSPEKSPDTPTYVELEFYKGIPVAVDGVKYEPIDMLTTLNKLGGAHGVGIIDIVENRLVGMKSRGVYETPGGTLLFAAHKALEKLTLDRDTTSFKKGISVKYAQLVYDGLWHTPLKDALDQFVNSTQEFVTGQVKLKLYKGNCTAVASASPFSLYNEDFVTFGEDHVYNQQDAEGFINLFALPLTIRALMLEEKLQGEAKEKKII
ncbi:Argininosuccinate synthase [Alkaliphilus metalliredigens QYMF]|uniref:Argininosuccinate synthase n=1 Tax=Alkaliphilus metalliredigens (strain QYMF) TaxID=293826 RepID=ASSY_ALKMQ|nr:argininosuccinate synthase [Alkaliphilus metalliredigens]A6TL10.1 RecName: Full=Argininosuccinate synthase; AltName: Full=Citrulline--aspartate ligase [Alkaliphilus metalliredigens QYMF]ABR46878.1 Argininosuccinate synthase [Alkaliphilus metalliredigens QYMF]